MLGTTLAGVQTLETIRHAVGPPVEPANSGMQRTQARVMEWVLARVPKAQVVQGQAPELLTLVVAQEQEQVQVQMMPVMPVLVLMLK
jgi:hypothetical protein